VVGTIKVQTKIFGFEEIHIPVHTDERGSFQQWFTQKSFGGFKNFEPVQANTSVSKHGVIRGIHYSTVDIGQSKMVICVSGKIRDVAVDIRKSSTTFGHYDVIDLEENSGKVAFISAGLGHAFEVLSESATIVYLLSSLYNKDLEKEINPLDPALNINWFTENPILSDKDRKAESFNDFTSRL